MDEHNTEIPTEIPVEIPPEALGKETLAGIIENFILREGTDYGVNEVGYDKKAEQVLKQIQRGDVKIVFDQKSETVSLIPASTLRKLSRNL